MQRPELRRLPPWLRSLALHAACAALCLALGAEHAHAQMRVRTGYYIGNATDNREVADVGFQPDVVIVRRADGTNYTFCRTATMPAGTSMTLEPGGALDTGIKSLTASGFTVGDEGWCNASGLAYAYIALKAGGQLTVSSYTGNGASQTIDPGFQPAYVLILRDGGADAPVQRFAGQSGDASFQFGSGSAVTGCITAFSSSGFSLGSDSRVNATGATYHYLALAQASGRVVSGSYDSGDGASRTISGLGFYPEWVMVKRDGALQWQRTHSMGTSSGSSLPFSVSFSPDSGKITGLASGSFTVHGSLNQSGGAYFYLAVGGGNPTAVRLAAFTATREAGGVRLSWRTGYGVDNLGFHLYREAPGGKRVRVTPSLVAGSALTVGAGVALRSGQGYTWLDPEPGEGPGRYWLEEWDLSGKRTWHGPATVAADARPTGDTR